MTESEFNRLLALTAADCIRAAEEHSNPTETSYPELSPETRARIRNHQRKTFARKQWGRRFTRVIAAMCAVFVVTVMCVPSVRATFFNMVETLYRDSIGIRFTEDETVTYPQTIEDRYIPELPEGWNMETNMDDWSGISLFLNGPNHEFISYQQMLFHPESETLQLDNDPVSTEIIYFGQIPATLYTYEDGALILMWNDRYTFLMTAIDTPRDTLLSIARSLKKTAVEPSAD